MNKELKLRVWDKNKKEYLKYPCYFNNSNFNEFICFDRLFKCDENDCIVQQFTGLRDKNKKEIYDGDIVNELYQGHPHLPFLITKKNIVVSWQYNKWNIGYDGITIGCYKYEIIGNIFENEDLIKEKDLGLDECEQCGENSWDGYICHSCGLKNI